MADTDDNEAKDSAELSWPDTSRPIISNRVPDDPWLGPGPEGPWPPLSRRRHKRRLTAVAAIIVVLAVVLVVWLMLV